MPVNSNAKARLARYVPMRAPSLFLLGFALHGSCQAAGGSFSSPGAALLLLHLPLLGSVLLLIKIAVDPSLRKKLRKEVKLVLVWVFGTIAIWMGLFRGFLDNSFGGLVLVLLFLAPWPVFITFYKSYKRAKQSEP
jgi:hypothetical protein